jgi:hypothetical protein
MSDRAVREEWKEGVCSYCGERTLVNDDHVIARTIWNEAPTTPVILDSCDPCHERKSVFEASLRDFLVLDPEAMDAASSKQKEKVLSALTKGKSIYAHVFQEALLRPGSRDTVPHDYTWVNMAIISIIRGLHFDFTGEPLMADETVYPLFIPFGYVDGYLSFFKEMPVSFNSSLGTGETWWTMVPPDPAVPTDDTYYWLICFWGKAHFMALAGSEAIEHIEANGLDALARANPIQ